MFKLDHLRNSCFDIFLVDIHLVQTCITSQNITKLPFIFQHLSFLYTFYPITKPSTFLPNILFSTPFFIAGTVFHLLSNPAHSYPTFSSAQSFFLHYRSHILPIIKPSTFLPNISSTPAFRLHCRDSATLGTPASSTR